MPMGRKQPEADPKRMRCGSDRHPTYAVPLLGVAEGVKWYNFRPYASRTYISKVADLPDLRDTPE